jgi:hypothetical protein
MKRVCSEVAAVAAGDSGRVVRRTGLARLAAELQLVVVEMVGDEDAVAVGMVDRAHHRGSVKWPRRLTLWWSAYNKADAQEGGAYDGSGDDMVWAYDIGDGHGYGRYDRKGFGMHRRDEDHRLNVEVAAVAPGRLTTWKHAEHLLRGPRPVTSLAFVDAPRRSSDYRRRTFYLTQAPHLVVGAVTLRHLDLFDEPWCRDVIMMLASPGVLPRLTSLRIWPIAGAAEVCAPLLLARSASLRELHLVTAQPLVELFSPTELARRAEAGSSELFFPVLARVSLEAGRCDQRALRDCLSHVAWRMSAAFDAVVTLQLAGVRLARDTQVARREWVLGSAPPLFALLPFVLQLRSLSRLDVDCASRAVDVDGFADARLSLDWGESTRQLLWHRESAGDACRPLALAFTIDPTGGPFFSDAARQHHMIREVRLRRLGTASPEGSVHARERAFFDAVVTDAFAAHRHTSIDVLLTGPRPAPWHHLSDSEKADLEWADDLLEIRAEDCAPPGHRHCRPPPRHRHQRVAS